MASGLFFYPFLLALLISGGLSAALSLLDRRILPIKERKRPGRVARWGGLAVISAFLVAIILDRQLVISRSVEALVGGSIVILFFGLWDDFRELGWKIQLFFQILLAGGIFVWGVRVGYVSNPLGGAISLENFWVGLLFVIGWMIMTVNSMNWLDGVDGSAGSVSFLGALAIFLVALKPEVNQPPVGIIAAAFGGAVGGFLLFNFYPARIIAGTSGSMFFGFVLGVLAIFAGAKIATALMVMMIPIVDFGWVVIQRVRSGQSAFLPDRRHLHYRLLQLGWSPAKISIFFLLLTSIIATLALNTRLAGKLAAILLSFGIVAGSILWAEVKLRNKNQKK